MLAEHVSPHIYYYVLNILTLHMPFNLFLIFVLRLLSKVYN
jgi:hypothetical protein